MATAAKGPISTAQDLLRVTLADCAEFRSWVGAGGGDIQTQARNRIHDEELPPKKVGVYKVAELQALRPFALIDTTSYRSEHAATGDHHEPVGSGTLEVRLEQDVPAAIKNNAGEIGRRLLNTVGTIIDELWELAGQSGYLAIESIAMFEPWDRHHKNKRTTLGDAVWVFLEIEWGNG